MGFEHTLLQGLLMKGQPKICFLVIQDALNGGTLMWNWGTDFGSQVLLCAARGLINHILYEAERLSGRRTIKSI
ncbi:hypothetical protein NC653_020849 [Populus alba x Populus x berolinensis]|uniref:Uncharacterized protein n=1 Tax=Populus alba x Populus x berolinensis TaxID=444605 RepID=A0AAD6MM32_9ROSI|nr:hypothetical protein NC653_020849 [Populus alba x Populus x berolinensis]